MRTIFIIAITLFTTLAYCKTEQWYKRSKVIYKDSNYIWFLGVAESRSLNEAQSESDLNAKKNLIEHFSINKLYNKSNLSERTNSSEAKDEVYTISDVLPVPIADIKIERVKQKDSSGKWLVYTDIAVKLSDIAKIKENKKSPTLEQALNEYERDDSNFREHYDKEENFLEKNHLIFWIPIMTDGLALSSFGYEYSFNKRRFALEYHGLARTPVEDEDSGSGGSFSPGLQEERIEKSYLDFNYSLSRSYNEQIIFSAGYLKFSNTKKYKYTFNGATEKEIQTLSGYSVALKYRKTWTESNGGYLINLRHENLSGEDFNGSDVSGKQQATLQLGFFYSF